MHPETTCAPPTADLSCRYAREVELSNGRAAMLGFLAGVVMEALTGRGIMGQVRYLSKPIGCCHVLAHVLAKHACD